MSDHDVCLNCGSPWMEGIGLYLCGEGTGNVAGGCRVPYTAIRIRTLMAELEEARRQRNHALYLVSRRGAA